MKKLQLNIVNLDWSRLKKLQLKIMNLDWSRLKKITIENYESGPVQITYLDLTFSREIVQLFPGFKDIIFAHPRPTPFPTINMREKLHKRPNPD